MLKWMIDNPGLAGGLVWLVALVVAWFINWSIITQGYEPKPIGPWSPVPKGMPRRTLADWLPLLGWWRLQRESAAHGPRYWWRPFLIELLFPLFILWMYYREVSGGMLFVPRLSANLQPELHSQFLAHFLLISFMMVATFIDFDEHVIPDSVTVLGTIAGLIGCLVLPAWFLYIPSGASAAEMHANSAGAWPAWMQTRAGLAIALLIVSMYCFALMDRVWITRRGLRKAWLYFWAMMFRTTWWVIVAVLWLFLVGLTIFAWNSGAARWQYYLTALIGLAAAGGYTWMMRLAAKQGLGVEALGFGDVTLMGMIGVYLGWQPSVIVFFIAPCYAVVIFLIRLLLKGSNAGAYGPYLCMAAATVILYWDYFCSEYAQAILELPPWMTWSILAATLLLMIGFLKIFRILRGRISGIRQATK